MRPQRPFKIAIFCSFLLFQCLLQAQTKWPGDASDWNGYQRYDFEADGRPCYVVVPNQAAPGKPWVWRARFTGFHTGEDLLLME